MATQQRATLPLPALDQGARGSFDVLGVRVNAIQIPEVVRILRQWIVRRDRGRYVAVTGMHGVVEAQHNSRFKEILNAADLTVPDGMPLVWLGRLRGFLLERRVYGPELMLALCADGAKTGVRHFFYGATPSTLESLAAALTHLSPNLEIAGMISPPFRTVTAAEDREFVSQINAARADVLWIGLSTPKQERWMFDHRDRVDVPVMIGVGAAFDIHAGRTKQAPVWMREHGLEWLFRLVHEPRRLWRRYLVYGSEFVFLVVRDYLRSAGKTRLGKRAPSQSKV
jgi:N-acetylglucosaminyldiphosphoundecaprenol N-acetyl-beta-D-mannosaminyltransferase